ncbi:MAG: M48 family metallopeptidase [Alphaproteobacteria bacterium]|nr:M48 family metallopeptidase [Alphaproteobacteria bacterium]MBU1562654.1 M48 family metallopeptidase [Alphaproteobacteria bacterium]MBU2303410.1 M48 family metallopeptidase [Alphaproteobacteria bacterium]MBU2366935.1 M48 family metallopeptidase [Alphaproteobacteria bacterium]
MAIAARFHDGLVAEVEAVELEYQAMGAVGTLVIRRSGDGAELGRWPANTLYALHGRRDELRLGANGQPAGARVVVEGQHDVARVLATLPVLTEKRRQEAGRQVRLAVTATVALAAVIAAYLYGVPLLASRIVGMVPAAWEASLGETVAGQMEASLGESGGLQLCDANPDSLANRAIARFGAEALAGSGSPFDLDIRVVRSDIPNAFALPGGQVFFFSSLLEQAQTQDEFAGVLAHEIGHVAYRHGMEQLISTAGTGALIGFILGDMTGLSVAAGLGATMIDARFSRDAERQADAFAAQVAQRLDFNPAGLADLINRVGADDEFARALALLNTHPLTEDRKAALEILSQQRPTGLEPPFTAAEWRAIRSMCGATPAAEPRTKTK